MEVFVETDAALQGQRSAIADKGHRAAVVSARPERRVVCRHQRACRDIGRAAVAAASGEHPLTVAIFDHAGGAAGLTDGHGKGIVTGVAAGQGKGAVAAVLKKVWRGGGGEAEGGGRIAARCVDGGRRFATTGGIDTDRPVGALGGGTGVLQRAAAEEHADVPAGVARTVAEAAIDPIVGEGGRIENAAFQNGHSGVGVGGIGEHRRAVPLFDDGYCTLASPILTHPIESERASGTDVP